MTFTQVSYFLTVADEGSFSRAAEKLFVSQPAVSKQISILENELGFRLFERVDRRIRLTDSGALLRDCMRRCMDDINSTLDSIRWRYNSDNMEVRIGCVEMWNPVTFFNPLQEHFTSNGSGVTLSIEAYNFGDMVSALREREVDLAVTYDYVLGNQRGIVSVPLAKLEVGIIYSLAHYGRSDRDLTLDDLCDVPVLLANGASDPFYHIVDHVFASYGLSGSRRPCHRESSVIMDALCGHGVLLGCNCNRLIGNSAFGYLPLGRELPISAAYIPDENHGTRKKELLIAEAISVLSNLGL